MGWRMDPFDLLAQVYDRFRRVPAPDPYLDLLGGNARLLDLGGGTGQVASALVPFGVRAVVLDRSRGMLSAAQKKRGLLLVRGSAESLPFPDESFDLVVVVDALHHFKDQERALREAARTVRRGGAVLIEEPDIRHLLVRWVWLVERLFGMRSRFLTPSQILDRLESCGLRGQVSCDAFRARIVARKGR